MTKSLFETLGTLKLRESFYLFSLAVSTISNAILLLSKQRKSLHPKKEKGEKIV